MDKPPVKQNDAKNASQDEAKNVEKLLEWQTIMTDFGRSVKVYTCGDPLRTGGSGGLDINMESTISPLMLLFHALQSIDDVNIARSIGYKLETMILSYIIKDDVLTTNERGAWKAVCDKLILYATDWKARRAVQEQRLAPHRCKHLLRNGKNKGKPCNTVHCAKQKHNKNADENPAPAKRKRVAD